MPDPLSNISTRRTSQTEQADPRQEVNAAGGYTFVADDLTRFRRFLATGTEGGTYYATEADHTAENAKNVIRLAANRGNEMLDVVLAASLGGTTVKQQPLMFSLAVLVASPDHEVRKRAIDAIPDLCRTGTHLFLFAKYVEGFRGWGRGLRRGIAAWYLRQSVDDLAYQMAKYQTREGWAHKDLLRLAHPVTDEPARRAAFDYGVGRITDGLPGALHTARLLAAAESVGDVVTIINAERALSWEMIPSQWLASSEVWTALIDAGRLPIGATLRNLARLTTNGTIAPLGGGRTAQVAARLTDPAVLAKGRVHPMSVLMAAATYASGRSVRGTGTWSPVREINKALDEAFPLAFGSITPEPDVTCLIGIDVSGSMQSPIAGMPLSCRTAAAALGQVYTAQFPNSTGVAFTGNNSIGYYGRGRVPSTLTGLDLDPTRRLTDLIRETDALPFGPTDCSMPIIIATEQKWKVDAFLVVTDNETWSGGIHPHQALREYREKSGIAARMVTVSMQANSSTIADPSDPLMLDVVGLDSSTVSLVGDFMAGRV